MVNSYALKITAAANHAIEKRWGEQTNPLNFGRSCQLAADLIAAEIPVEVACESIAAQCDKKRGEKPGTIEYFRLGIVAHNRARIQREFDQANPALGQRSGDKEPTRIHVTPADTTLRDQKQHRTDFELNAEYTRERSIAIADWAKAHPERYRLIVAAANAERHAMLEKAGRPADSPLGTKARDAKIAERCAEEAGFADFETWKTAYPYRPEASNTAVR